MIHAQPTASPSPNGPPPVLPGEQIATNAVGPLPTSDQTLVNLRADNDVCTLTVGALHSTDGLLPSLYQEAVKQNNRDPLGRVQITLKRADPALHHVAHYLNRGNLPTGLKNVDRTNVKRSARLLGMTTLTQEIDTFYALREATRKSKPTRTQYPYDHLTDLLLLAAALVCHGQMSAGLSHSTKAEHRYDVLTDTSIAQAAFDENEIRRSSMLFGYILLRRMSPFAKIKYLQVLHTVPPSSHFIGGDAGYHMATWSLFNESELFLCKASKILHHSSLSYKIQEIRVRYLAAGLCIQAETYTYELINQFGRKAELTGLLGEVLRYQGRIIEAGELLQQAVQDERSHLLSPYAHLALGDCSHLMGRYDEANRQYSIAARKAPYDAAPHSALGNNLHNMGRYAEAETWRRALIELTPTASHVHLDLAQTVEAQHRYHEAAQIYDVGLQNNPFNLDLLQGRLGVAQIMGDTACAIDQQRRIAYLSPDNPQPWQHLGYLLHSNHQPDLAQLAFDEAHRIMCRPVAAAAEASGEIFEATLSQPFDASPITPNSALFLAQAAQAADDQDASQMEPLFDPAILELLPHAANG